MWPGEVALRRDLDVADSTERYEQKYREQDARRYDVLRAA